MDERLKLAEAYYAVARDMQAQGERCLSYAKELGAIADRICEQNIAEKRQPDSAFEQS